MRPYIVAVLLVSSAACVPGPADDEQALRGLVAAFSDAVVHADTAAFRDLWTADARWTIAPPIEADMQGREAIAQGFAGLMGGWEFLIQVPGYDRLDVQGDSATGRWLMREVGRGTDGAGQRNYGLYDDRYVRTPDGWRFARRDYRYVLLDTSAVEGVYAAPVP